MVNTPSLTGVGGGFVDMKQRLLPFISRYAKQAFQVVAGLLAVGLITLVVTGLGFWRLSQGDLFWGQRVLAVTSPVVRTISLLGLQRISVLEVWSESVWLAKELAGLQLTAQEHEADFAAKLQLLATNSGQLQAHTAQLERHFSRSWLAHNLIPEAQYQATSQFLSAASVGLEWLSSAQQSAGRYLILLQNTDELRATGGFIGSYTVLDFGSDEPWRWEVRDIYDPSGVSVSLPAPAGHAEYLSSGEGMKLHDANWHPDFPTSAELILQYFAKIHNDPQHYDGVIAIPLSAVEELIEAVGGVYSAEEERWISSEEFAAAARQNRAEFFPGSREKEQSLQSLYAALRLRLGELSLADWQAAVMRLAASRSLEEVQVYAVDSELEQQLNEAGIAGRLAAYGPAEIFLFPVESNVGINKANRGITRELTATIDGRLLTVTTIFQNHFTEADRPLLPTENTAYTVAEHLGYANYHRLLVRSDMRVQSVMVNDQRVEEVDEEIIISNGSSYLQVGFLVTVPEGAQTTVAVQFLTPNFLTDNVLFQRQAGAAYESLQLVCPTGETLPLASVTARLYTAACTKAVE